MWVHPPDEPGRENTFARLLATTSELAPPAYLPWLTLPLEAEPAYFRPGRQQQHQYPPLMRPQTADTPTTFHFAPVLGDFDWDLLSLIPTEHRSDARVKRFQVREQHLLALVVDNPAGLEVQQPDFKRPPWRRNKECQQHNDAYD